LSCSVDESRLEPARDSEWKEECLGIGAILRTKRPFGTQSATAGTLNSDPVMVVVSRARNSDAALVAQAIEYI
jgi:hypothetical protein